MNGAGGPAASAPGASLPAACPNCGAAVYGPYCAQCGQETVIERLTLREFGHEYIQSFVSLEGRLWRTLWLLLVRPGQLTVEFLEGRRRRYVRPIPLYLSTSFVLFLILAIFPTTLVRVDKGDEAIARKELRRSIAPATAQSPASAASAALAPVSGSDWPAWVQPVANRFIASLQRMSDDPLQSQQRLSAAVLPKLPYAAFFLVPFFALVTRLLYRKRRRNYAEHFLLSLHVHSFAFLSLTLACALPEGLVAGTLPLAWGMYLSIALRRVFGGRWWPQVLRALLLMLIESLMLGAEMSALALVLIAFVV